MCSVLFVHFSYYCLRYGRLLQKLLEYLKKLRWLNKLVFSRYLSKEIVHSNKGFGFARVPNVSCVLYIAMFTFMRVALDYVPKCVYTCVRVYICVCVCDYACCETCSQCVCARNIKECVRACAVKSAPLLADVEDIMSSTLCELRLMCYYSFFEMCTVAHVVSVYIYKENCYISIEDTLLHVYIFRRAVVFITKFVFTIFTVAFMIIIKYRILNYI